MTKLLSIVVPSYNAADYLTETIPYLLASPSAEQVEILIVNDGSKDKTAEVAATFANQYPTIVQVINKENGGHGSTINAGLAVARGHYFKVIDADDWVDTDHFEALLQYLQTVNVDMVVSPYTKVFMDSQTTEVDGFTGVEHQHKYLADDFLKRVGAIPWMHAVVYRRQLLLEAGLQLDEHMFYVDIEYITFPLHLMKEIAYFDLPVYQYRLGNPTQSVSMASYLKNQAMHYHIIDRVTDYYLQTPTLTETKKFYLEKLINHLVATQMKIYLSYEDLEAGKQAALDFDQFLRMKNDNFISLKHSAKLMKVLLVSRYQLFNLVAAYVKRKFH